MTPRPAAPELAREDERQQKLAALGTRLHEDAQALRTSDDWAARLRMAALMPGEDFANILLISSQLPGATMVRDYRQWTATGRQVRRHEKSIETFYIPPRPAPRRPQDHDQRGDDEPPPTWRDADRVAHVWDLSQTTGQPLTVPAGLPPPGQAPAGLWDALCWLARREGFTVEREDGAPADGTTFWAVRRIRLLPGLTGEQATWALAHQFGHILLHSTPGGHPPGTTTTGCTGLRKAEADAVAYVTCARHGVTASSELAYPASWAGTDPRAQPAATILAVGHRITTATARIIRHTDRILRGDDPAPVPAPRQQPPTPAARHDQAHDDEAVSRQAAAAAAPRPRPGRARASWPSSATPRPATPASSPEAGRPRTCPAAASPSPRRGTGTSDTPPPGGARSPATCAASATTTARSRQPGSPDHPPAAPSSTSSGTGSCSRSATPTAPSPGSSDAPTRVPRLDVPKYLNSPETAAYKKGSLLFGLHHARPALARGATPVLVEGPFDAIAVTTADPGRYAGLAPCGTALTSQQAALISQAADLDRTGILVAFDSDTAGRKAALRAHGILRPLTANLQAAILDGKDPAEILQQHGQAALRAALRDRRQPLSAMLIDARIESWERRLDNPVGQYLAMLNVAVLIADLLPEETARQIRRITAGRELQTFDDQLHHVDNPELAEIARILPADTAYQTVRTAARLDFDVSDVLTVVTNAVTLDARSPKGQEPALRDNREHNRPALCPEASRLAGTSLPIPPLSPPAGVPALTQAPARDSRPARRGGQPVGSRRRAGRIGPHEIWLPARGRPFLGAARRSSSTRIKIVRPQVSPADWRSPKSQSPHQRQSGTARRHLARSRNVTEGWIHPLLIRLESSFLVSASSAARASPDVLALQVPHLAGWGHEQWLLLTPSCQRWSA